MNTNKHCPKLLGLGLALLIGILSAASAQAAVYKWTFNENGIDNAPATEVEPVTLDQLGVPAGLSLSPVEIILYEQGTDFRNPANWSDALDVDGRSLTFYSDINDKLSPQDITPKIFVEETGPIVATGTLLDANGGPTQDKVELTLNSDVPEFLGPGWCLAMVMPLLLAKLGRNKRLLHK
jgi:hypothetical protein